MLGGIENLSGHFFCSDFLDPQQALSHFSPNTRRLSKQYTPKVHFDRILQSAKSKFEYSKDF